MNYRDYFKNKKATPRDIQSLIPEGVDPNEFNKGIGHEKEHTEDEFIAAKIAGDHLKEDPKYYTKLDDAGLEEEGCCEELGDEYDDNDGLPTLGGALAVPHVGQPIRLGKIIQIGADFGKGASGELSGMTNCDGGKDKGGIPANQPSDKEPITAGGKAADSSIASKTVGGSVVPGDGQKQGGPNSKGTIAGTSKLDENKQKLRRVVKDVLKEIRYNKKTGKWERISENVDQKMGPSYKTIQPRQYKVQDDDFARTNQYEPEITEMYDDEEECSMNERYVELANADRNLSEAELAELKSLREKIDRLAETHNCHTCGRPVGTNSSCKSCGAYKKTQDTINSGKCERCGSKINPGISSTLCPSCHEDSLSDAESYYDVQEDTTNVQITKRNDGLSTGGTEPSLYDEEEVLKKTECPMCGAKTEEPGVLCHKCTMNKADAGDKRNLYGGDDEEVFEDVNMKMGASYKKVSPTQSRCSKCDQARTIQYDPEMTEGENIDEAGGQAVQHRSYRTIDDVPQNPDARWDDEVDEGTKVSKTTKTIKKGMKSKKSTFSQSLKHKQPKKTSSGVHKRKR